jgi:hypothetical protein
MIAYAKWPGAPPRTRSLAACSASCSSPFVGALSRQTRRKSMGPSRPWAASTWRPDHDDGSRRSGKARRCHWPRPPGQYDRRRSSNDRPGNLTGRGRAFMRPILEFAGRNRLQNVPGKVVLNFEALLVEFRRVWSGVICISSLPNEPEARLRMALHRRPSAEADGHPNARLTVFPNRGCFRRSPRWNSL